MAIITKVIDGNDRDEGGAVVFTTKGGNITDTDGIASIPSEASFNTKFDDRIANNSDYYG